jgi:5-methylthioadenosine/S-adenosylhomocysteine deaminase
MVRDGTLLACAEMLRGGITCFNDMYYFPEASLEAARGAGMRVALGLIVIEFPTPYASDAADYLRKGLALRDREGDDPLVSFCLAPHAPYTVSDATLRQVAKLAAELDLPVHVHLSETEEEVRRSVSEHGVRPVERLRRLGVLGPNLIAVHAVHLEKPEIDLLGGHAVSIAHCPSSNLKLASGFAPVEALRRAGANVCLGTDGAASNNRLDLFQEMRTAALLAKALARDAQALPAHAALRAATLGGAQALGRDDLGRIAVGARADLVLWKGAAWGLTPLRDPVKNIVYNATAEDVDRVWVNGRLVVDGGRVLGCDEHAVLAALQAAGERMWPRMREGDWAGRDVEELSPMTYRTWEPDR